MNQAPSISSGGRKIGRIRCAGIDTVSMPGMKMTGATTTVQLDGGGIAHAAIPTQPGDEGMRVNLGVRPEDMVETDGDVLFEGQVDLSEALGEVTLHYFGTNQPDGKAPVVAKLPGIHRDMGGKTVRLTAAPEKLHLFHDGRSLLYRH